MELQRTIHPIGQGAFYSEKLVVGKKHVNVVYDCGYTNSSLGTSLAEKVVDEAFTETDVIDILFISHFHADHMNLVYHLSQRVKEIRNVVIPDTNLSTEDWEFILSFQKKVEQIPNISFTEIFNPAERLKDSHIIQVSPIDNDGDNIYVSESRTYSIDDLQNIKEISANDAINVTNTINTIEWIYRPFNKKISFDIESIKQRLEEKGINIKDSKWLDDDEKVEDVKNQWKEFNNKLNNTSLMVFSTPKDSVCNKRFHHFCHHHCCDIDCYNMCCNRFIKFPPIPSCLYTGDITLSDDVVKLINKKVKDYEIGTMQIPHHGSHKSWSKGFDIHNLFYSQFFLSYGTNNSYEHPNTKLLIDFAKKGRFIQCVNEITLGFHQIIHL